MAEDKTPEVDIPMPEPPPPANDMPLYTFFPFGIINALIFGLIDLIMDAKFLPHKIDIDTHNAPLWTYFPFGPPVFLVLGVVEFVFSLVQAMND